MQAFMKKQGILALFLVFLMLLPLAGCMKPQKEPLTKTYYEYFDTVCALYSYADESEEEFLKNCRMIEEIFEKYNKELDIYYEYSGVNNLCTVNKRAGQESITVKFVLLLSGFNLCRKTDF